MDINFEPSCRYGHGSLEKDQIEKDHFWGIVGAQLKKMNATSPVGAAIQESRPSGGIYSVHIYRCPVCGYIELFDRD